MTASLQVLGNPLQSPGVDIERDAQPIDALQDLEHLPPVRYRREHLLPGLQIEIAAGQLRSGVLDRRQPVVIPQPLDRHRVVEHQRGRNGGMRPRGDAGGGETRRVIRTLIRRVSIRNVIGGAAAMPRESHRHAARRRETHRTTSRLGGAPPDRRTRASSAQRAAVDAAG